MTDARSSRRGFLATGAATIGVAVAGCLGDNTDEWATDETLAVASATQYQGPNCDCCSVYADYLEDHLEGDLETVTTDDLAAVKAEYGIAEPLQSCHTIDLDRTIVEGHVPVAVVASALEDDVAGIALPGMPAGSPGMGGEKDEEWTVYEFGDGGEPAVYTEL